MIRLLILAFFTTSLIACQSTRVVEGPSGVYEILHRDGGVVKFPWNYRITASPGRGLVPAEQLTFETAVQIKGQAFSEKPAAGYIDRRDDGRLEIRLISRRPHDGSWYHLPISGIHPVHPKVGAD